jgi:ribosomal protein L27
VAAAGSKRSAGTTTVTADALVQASGTKTSAGTAIITSVALVITSGTPIFAGDFSYLTATDRAGLSFTATDRGSP